MNDLRSTDRLTLVFATKGAASNDETRIQVLLSKVDAVPFPFDRRGKLSSARQLIAKVRRDRPELLVMEGTGLAGGVACLIGRLFGCRYVVSSGDAVGPWVAMRSRPAGWVFAVYERILCRFAAGFIGWTPYLVGRALTFGVPRAMTAAGWCQDKLDPAQAASARARIRAQFNIPDDHLVYGIVGSINRSKRYGYSYGLELVQAVLQVDRPDVHVLIVGDGPGLPHLQQLAAPRANVHFAGRAPANEVLDYLAAMDVGSLPQSVDGVGSFRYTTKISEYLEAGLPVVTGQIPLAYDFHGDWLWRLPGNSPWDARYTTALADLMRHLTREQVDHRRRAVPRDLPDFNRDLQIARATEFFNDLLNDSPDRKSRSAS